MKPEISLAEKLARTRTTTIRKLGLRFDRVVLSLQDELRDYGKAHVPKGIVVVVTTTAPIKLPAKTSEKISARISRMLETEDIGPSRRTKIHGNDVRIRIARGRKPSAPAVLTFVHNVGSDVKSVVDFAISELTTRSLD